MTDRRWRLANNIIFAAIIAINGYIIAVPLLPQLAFWWQTNHSATQQTLTQRLAAPKHTTKKPSTPPPQQFHADASHDGLIIPKMLLETPLIEGPERDSFALLNKGAWRLPFTTTPDKGGNTVVAGHRFSYTGPRGVFYFLNKLEPGDMIGLWYHGTLYRYRVESTRTVAPTEVSVQEPTTDTRLTLYTCTPLWKPVDRLVVVAKPVTETPA